MAVVYSKLGEKKICSEDDAKILIASGHFTAKAPKYK